MPRIVMFPTGLCIWLSLQVSGQHDFDALAEIVGSICDRNAKVLALDDGTTLDMDDCFALMEGAIEDAFGEETDVRSDGPFVMTAVLAGDGEQLNMAAPGQLTAALQTITRDKNLAACHTPLKGAPGSRNFFLASVYNYFLWYQDHLLDGHDYSLNKLYCYHSNTVRAMMIHWQERNLLERLAERDWQDAQFAPLAKDAFQQLCIDPAAPPSKGTIWNKLLKRQLEDPGLTALLKSVPATFGGPPPAVVPPAAPGPPQAAPPAAP